MTKEPLTANNIEAYVETIEKLAPDARPIFGVLDARGMLRHLRSSFESSVGEPEAEDSSKPVVRAIVWVLFFNLFTNWPGGKIKAPPAATPPAEHEFEEERRLLIKVMRRFAGKLELDPNEKHVNPRLGPLRLAQWSKLHGIHCAHHFRQFELVG